MRYFYMQEFWIMEQKTLRIQPRDVAIFKFLDKVGYAPISQIVSSLGVEVNDNEKSQAALVRRLSQLQQFSYIKTFSTQNGNYYALDKKSRGDNHLITSIKLDQLPHHDFLSQLFLLVQNNPLCFNVVSEREVITNYKTIGKSGKVPDMIINDWIIEYERTSKSVMASRDVVDYWTCRERRRLCIIYETNEIHNRYNGLLNPRVKLLSRVNYTDIFQIIGASELVQTQENNKIDYEVINAIRSKYL